LAVEAHELWRQESRETTALPGVEAHDETSFGCPVNVVTILDDNGVRALDKPVGTYITVTLPLRRHDADAFENGVNAACAQLRSLLSRHEWRSVLVIGLGNRDITPDAVGPLALESTMITRHLVTHHPEHFGHLTPVSALTPGVLSATGMETVDILKGVIENMKPDIVLIIDALASRHLSRLCTTLQLCDTGIIPGSGVGNARAALNRDTLGLPVIAIGVPTVVDAGTLAADLLEEAGQGEFDPQSLRDHGGGLIVTPKDIDSLVAEVARTIGYAVSSALHEEFSISDIRGFLS